jgi:YfiR/HmsC-like
MRSLLAAVIVALAVAPARGQDPPLEYQVKAAYLYNFLKFVEWPARAVNGSLTICIAGRSPFGDALDDIVRDESIEGHAIAARVAAAPQPGCNVVFVPHDVPAAEFLRAARTAPVLTVGESADFIAQGGVINFVRDAGMIRFEIDQEAATRAGLRISSRLLRLARNPVRDQR